MWLAIEGVVGAGKTTTAKLIGERPETESVIERLEDHPFLEAYYRNPRRYSVETEIMFMLLQVHQLRDVDPTRDIVSDFSPAKNLIFARTNSPGENQRFLADLHSRLWQGLPRPHIAVFLDVPANVCLDRVIKRGRSYEQGIEVGELIALRSAYLDSLAILADRVETLTLDGTETPEAVAVAATHLAVA